MTLKVIESWGKDPVTLTTFATFMVTTPNGLEVRVTRDGRITYPSARLEPHQALELASALRLAAEWAEKR